MAPLIHPFGKPGGGQLAGNFRAFQLNAWQHFPRQFLAGGFLRQGIDSLIQVGVGKLRQIALLQRPTNRRVAHVQPLAEGAYRQLGGARLIGTVVNQVAVQRQRNARRAADCALEGRVAAGVPTGIEVGKAVNRLAVVGRIAQQVSDTEIHAATAAKDFAANGAVNRVWIAFGMGFGEGNTHLHRPGGMHRIEAAKQFLPHRHRINHVIKDIAQIFLGAHLIEPLAVALAVW
ncbi:hypothetical protein D3C80_924980 [compost metagenome]